jgi:hypothetical protein
LADGTGQLASVEGSPTRLAVERSRGHLARVYYGTRQMTDTPAGQPVTYHPKCQQAFELLRASRGKLDRRGLQKILETPPITNEMTIDQMIFNTTLRRALLNRDPLRSGKWKEYRFA